MDPTEEFYQRLVAWAHGVALRLAAEGRLLDFEAGDPE